MECSHCYVDYFLPLQSLYYLRLPDVGIGAMTQSKVVPLSPEKKIKIYTYFESVYIKYICNYLTFISPKWTSEWTSE